MPPANLETIVSRVNSWDDWVNVEKDVFRLDEWKRTPIDELEADDDRPDIDFGGVMWTPFLSMYDVDADLVDAYENTRQMVFEKLDPAGHSENLAHPESYGRKCNSCKVWTRISDRVNCPFCERKLMPFVLN